MTWETGHIPEPARGGVNPALKSYCCDISLGGVNPPKKSYCCCCCGGGGLTLRPGILSGPAAAAEGVNLRQSWLPLLLW